MKNTVISICVGVAAVAGIAIFGQSHNSAPTQTDEEARQEVLANRGMSDSNNLVRHFTKAELDSAVFGKTKAEVRQMLGKPDNVDDGADAWYYWHLPVYDETAGIQVNNTKIRFEGIAGDQDTAAEVSYP
jgi:outer membrane protein assembly factor BamE (lipoprotein component of BamABCDE complex)